MSQGSLQIQEVKDRCSISNLSWTWRLTPVIPPGLQGVQGQRWPHRKLEVSLGYRARLSLLGTGRGLNDAGKMAWGAQKCLCSQISTRGTRNIKRTG